MAKAVADVDGHNFTFSDVRNIANFTIRSNKINAL